MKDKSRNPNSAHLIGKSEPTNSADVEKQIALERRSFAELLLDFYEARVAKQRGVLDAEQEKTTMKERSKTNANKK